MNGEEVIGWTLVVVGAISFFLVSYKIIEGWII